MSGKGDCHDKAAVGISFKTFTAALIRRQSWATQMQAERAIPEYINGFHNPRRRNSAPGGENPVAFERKVA